MIPGNLGIPPTLILPMPGHGGLLSRNADARLASHDSQHNTITGDYLNAHPYLSLRGSTTPRLDGEPQILCV